MTQPFEPTPSPMPPQRPRSDEGLPWFRTILLTVVVAAVIVGGFGAWYVLFRPAGPAPLGTGAPVVPGSPSPGVSTAPVATPAPSVVPQGSPPPAGALDGTWSVDPAIGSFDYAAGDFSGSWVGYRVQEELAGVGGTTAVGRTPEVTGSLTLSGTTVTEASFEADLTTLRSDESMRDGQLGRQGIQTDRFPSATFVLAEPIELGTLPAVGQDVAVTAVGDLTLHGVTKRVSIPLHAALHEGVIAIAASYTFGWDDFDMERPSAARVLSLADEVTMETQLFFRRQG